MQQIELRLQNRKGAILVLAAISVVTLTIALAVVLDLSRLYVQRNELQTGADAGALAGAIQIAADSTSVHDTAVAFATRNMVLNGTVTLASANVQCGVWNDTTKTFSTTAASLQCGNAANAVQVTRVDSTHYLFPQILNASSTQIATTAVAWVAPAVTRSNCVKPLAVQDVVLFNLLNTYRTTQRAGNTLDDIDFQILRTHASDLTFCVKDGAAGGGTCPGGQAPGNYNPIQLPPGDNGGNVYRDNIGTCSAVDVGVGDVLSVETGNVVGPTNQGVNTWCSQFPANQCSIKLVLWHDQAAAGATAPDGSSCQAYAVGSHWCVTVSMLGAAILTPNAGGPGVLTGHFTMLNDPGGGIGNTPGLLHRVILVK